MEVKKVTSGEYYRALSELQIEAYEIAGRRIHIYDPIHVDDLMVELKINWSAIGNVSIEEARDFSNKLQTIIKLVESFKYNGYCIDYSH